MRALSALLALLAAVPLAAQPKFETASVRPVKTFAGEFPARRTVASPGRIEYREYSLKDLLIFAYRVQFFQLPTPAWMDDAFFTVQATLPPDASQEDVAAMLRNLLIERFRLKMLRVPKDLNGYVLTVGAGELKIKESPPAPDAPPPPAPGGLRFDLDSDGFIVVPAGQTHILMMPARDGVQRLTAARASMEMFCGYLRRVLQQPVLDRTGLKGIYDFRVAFAPLVSAPGAPWPEEPSEELRPAPILTKAVESQLGLKLTGQAVRVDTFVIEHIDRTPVEQ